MKTEIVFATQNDVSEILKFIKALAKYEKLEHEVVVNESLLAHYLFGEKSYAEVILLKEESRSVGFALFFPNFSTFLGRPGIYLEDLFVFPEFRGKGYGKKLLKFLAALAMERGCGRLEWSVLNWNQPAIDFYNSLGAKSMSGWTVNRLTGDDLKKLGN